MKSVRRIENHNLKYPYQAKMRVAAYCRVSTKSDEQLGSLACQKEYYEMKIRSCPDWQFAGIYAEVASGRNINSRKQFQLMLSECRQGKLDLILTKSIARLGRNTLDMLICLRELRQLGVEVHFEIENILLSDQKAELMLTILASVAQDESLHKSQSIRWGIQRSFEKENSKYLNRICYGYCHDQNRKLVIDIIQAEIIRTIFCLHLDGYSLRRISKELSDQEILSPRGSQHWGTETLNKILKNEKYIGNVLLQKTVVDDYLIGKQLKNEGRENQYLISDSHPAIIEREIFDLVNCKKKF